MKENASGWKKFRAGFPWFSGEKKYPLQAYSEFMPPLRTGISPVNGEVYPWVFSEDDPYGWQVYEYEEEYHLRPGLVNIGSQVMEHLAQMGAGTLPIHLAGHQQRNLKDNIFWPAELSSHAGNLPHENYTAILPLSLSKTKDDKGRVLWTFFGASEQGPEKVFWKSFYEAPGKEVPFSVFLGLLQWLFATAYDMKIRDGGHLKEAGFRILPSGDAFPLPWWNTKALPSWTNPYVLKDSDSFENVKWLLSFRPFTKLPPEVKEKYLAGRLSLIPFPGSLLLWGIPAYLKLQEKLYNAIQIPMLRLVKRSEGLTGIRVPQSGWLHQPRVPGEKAEILEDLILNSYIRTNRWNRFMRYEDALLKSTEVDPVIQTLFSTSLAALDLYNKPMARNCQLFTEDFELLLDGPRAGRKEIGVAGLKIIEGGLFRYRFYFPAMNAGLHEVWWHRPLAACIDRKSGKPEIAPDLITGYMTGYTAEKPDPSDAVELWPRFHRREPQLSLLRAFDPVHDHYLHQNPMNLLALFDTWEFLRKQPLERDFARDLVRITKSETLEEWLSGIPQKTHDKKKAALILKSVEDILQPVSQKIPELPGLTYSKTANRKYEESFWNQIRFLAHGDFINKDNADVVQDTPTLEEARHRKRDLHDLGNYLIRQYTLAIGSAGMKEKAEVGEIPFRWETDFEFPGYGGWQANQEGSEYERNILVVIPGKNRNEAVIMADHYDTAYMEDVFNTHEGGTGARLSAAGADDNHSATSTLLLAAPIYLEMAKKGMLEQDIWLLHLTGEEFPSDCMGARDICRNIVQRTLMLHRRDGTKLDLSQVKINGVLVMDMIAHNRDNDRDIFQIAPGKSIGSIDLAQVAHRACQDWKVLADKLNSSPDRKGLSPGRRSSDRMTIPVKALVHKPQGEVRTWEDPHSSIYNTDGIIFSDTGIPVILFMENYDIHRSGYHDTHDTMENIDLDYGSAVSAIAIETIARLATG
jgi:hypothetical protein